MREVASEEKSGKCTRKRSGRLGWAGLRVLTMCWFFFVVSLFQLLDFFICIASALTNDYTTDDDL